MICLQPADIHRILTWLCGVLYTEVFSPLFLHYSLIIVNRVTMLMLSKIQVFGIGFELVLHF